MFLRGGGNVSLYTQVRECFFVEEGEFSMQVSGGLHRVLTGRESGCGPPTGESSSGMAAKTLPSGFFESQSTPNFGIGAGSSARAAGDGGDGARGFAASSGSGQARQTGIQGDGASS